MAKSSKTKKKPIAPKKKPPTIGGYMEPMAMARRAGAGHRKEPGQKIDPSILDPMAMAHRAYEGHHRPPGAKIQKITPMTLARQAAGGAKKSRKRKPAARNR